MNKELHFSSKSNEWETPKHIFNYYNKIYNFQLDAAATKENALCENFYTLEDNSLIQNWNQYKTIWCNPPYGREIGKFVKKAYEESLKGCIVVLLIPARVDTKWWHEYCSLGNVYFIKGRLKFTNKKFYSYEENINKKNILSAPFPSAIIIFNNSNPTTNYIKF